MKVARTHSFNTLLSSPYLPFITSCAVRFMLAFLFKMRSSYPILLLLASVCSSLFLAEQLPVECSQYRLPEDLINLVTPNITQACDSFHALVDEDASYVTPSYILYGGPIGGNYAFHQILDVCVSQDYFYGGRVEFQEQTFNLTKSCGVFNEIQSD